MLSIVYKMARLLILNFITFVLYIFYPKQKYMHVYNIWITLRHVYIMCITLQKQSRLCYGILRNVNMFTCNKQWSRDCYVYVNIITQT